jgi:hypothetical protein
MSSNVEGKRLDQKPTADSGRNGMQHGKCEGLEECVVSCLNAKQTKFCEMYAEACSVYKYQL